MAKNFKEGGYHKFISGPFYRFDDRNTGFSRFHREQMTKMEVPPGAKGPSGSSTAVLQKGNPLETGKRKGFGKKDYALSWAGRTIDYLVRSNVYARDPEVDGPRVDILNPSALTLQIKDAARWFGADLVGVCKVNPAWVYSHWGDYNAFYSGGLVSAGDPIEIPSWLKYAVVIAVKMEYKDIKRSPALDASTSLCYSKMSFVAASLATYIRQFGYHAMPSGNEYGLNIPLAIDAGLGELGRNGQLITNKYGPRVRISKVFTELPLEVDAPVDLGVQDFCEKCRLCAEHCPSGAIMKGDRTDQPWDVSNSCNVFKWPIKAMKCMYWWEENGSHCSNCIRTCPFNKPKGWMHTSTKRILQTTSVFDKLFIKLDKAFGYGKQVLR